MNNERRIEMVRNRLNHLILSDANYEEILQVSIDLDELIFNYYHKKAHGKSNLINRLHTM